MSHTMNRRQNVNMKLNLFKINKLNIYIFVLRSKNHLEYNEKLFLKFLE